VWSGCMRTCMCVCEKRSRRHLLGKKSVNGERERSSEQGLFSKRFQRVSSSYQAGLIVGLISTVTCFLAVERHNILFYRISSRRSLLHHNFHSWSESLTSSLKRRKKSVLGFTAFVKTSANLFNVKQSCVVATLFGSFSFSKVRVFTVSTHIHHK